MWSITWKFDNAIEYIKIFLYNLQRVIFWSRYILLYLIGGVVAFSQLRLVLYYHNIFMLMSLLLALVLTVILLPKITGSDYFQIREKVSIPKKYFISLKSAVNFWAQYIADVSVGFTLTSHMLMFYSPQIAIMLLRSYSPLILLSIAFVFYIDGLLNYDYYHNRSAINRAFADCNTEAEESRDLNKVHFAITIVLSLVAFFGLNKYFFGMALIFYVYSPPTLIAAAIFILGSIFARLGFTRNCWHVVQSTAVVIGTSYTTMLLGKILYLSFYSSMLVTTDTTILVALPSIPFMPLVFVISFFLGLGYGYIYYHDLVAEHRAMKFLISKDILDVSLFSSSLNLSEANINSLNEDLVDPITEASLDSKSP